MSDTPTGPWVKPMIRAKATDPRNGLPSWNQLGMLAGLSTSTVTSMISGSRKTSTETIRKIAKVLDQEPETISEWLELDRKVRQRYSPPPEADLLTDRQRKALTNLIRSIVADESKEVSEHGNSSNEKSHSEHPRKVRAKSVKSVDATGEARQRRGQSAGT